MEEYIDLFENIIAKTRQKVDYMDIRFGMGDNTSILMKDGNVDEINTGMSLGARIRVLNNGAWGFAYTTDLSKIDEITETALKLSKSLKGDVKLSESEIIKDKIEVDVKIPFKDVSIEEKKDIMDLIDDSPENLEIIEVPKQERKSRKEPAVKEKKEKVVEKDYNNCLRRERVIVRYLMKEDGLNPKHPLHGGMLDGAVKVYTVPRLSSGTLVRSSNVEYSEPSSFLRRALHFITLSLISISQHSESPPVESAQWEQSSFP